MIDAARLRSFQLFGDLDEYDLSQVARWVVEVQAEPGELLIETVRGWRIVPAPAMTLATTATESCIRRFR